MTMRNTTVRASILHTPPCTHGVVRLEGYQVFVDGDIPATVRIMQEVIHIEPRTTPVWA